LAPEQAVELILLPGFSAADSVSQLAGRGVGLSAVLQEVQEMEGSLLVKSNEGIGTEFVFDLPFHGRRPS
jgi:chemotaxis protein histidine kinase CheA